MIRRSIAAIIVPLLVASAAANPDLSAEPAGRPVLQLLEARLPVGSVVAVPGGAPTAAITFATDLDVGDALSSLLSDLLAPPSTFVAEATALVQELCTLRPAQAPRWVQIAAAAYLAAGLDSAEDDIVRAVSAGVLANPGSVTAITRGVFASILAAGEQGHSGAPGLSDAAASRAIHRVTAAAVSATRSQPNAPTLIFGMVGETLRFAAEQQSSALFIEVLASTAEATRDLPAFPVADLARFAYSEAARTREFAGVTAAAIVRGAGVEAASTVKDQAALTLSVPLASFVTLAVNAAVTMSASTEPAGPTIARSITVTTVDFTPALMIGAIVARPDDARGILLSGLNRDLVLRGRATCGDILYAALLAAPEHSADLAAAAVGRGDLEEGNQPALLADAIGRGAPPARVAAAIAAQVQSSARRVEVAQAITAGALSGSTVASRFAQHPAITRGIAEISGFAGPVLEQALISAPRQLQYPAILGVLAADPAQAPALLDSALRHPALEPQQLPPLQAAGQLFLELQRAPGSFFPATLRRLTDPALPSPDITAAILRAAALANPRGIHAIIAAAAIRPDAASPAELCALAAQGKRGIAAELDPVVQTARSLADEPGAFLRIVQRQVALHRQDAPAIIAGAVAARPELAPVIGEAGARTAPECAAAILRTLFAFSGSRHPLAPPPESDAAHAAALVSAVLRGVSSARLDSDSAHALIDDVVASGVRCIFALSGAAPAPPLPELGALILASIQAAPGRTLEITRSAASAARSMSGPAFPQSTLLAAAVSAQSVFTSAQVTAAITRGVQDSDRHVPAAGARAVADYTRESLTGSALTRYLDL